MSTPTNDDMQPYQLTRPRYGAYYEVSEKLGGMQATALFNVFTGKATKLLDQEGNPIDEVSRHYTQKICRRRGIIIPIG